MSLQEDLEAFRDLALEEQDRINALPEPPDPEEIYDALDPLLASVINGYRVSLSGAVVVPVVDESGEIAGEQLETEPVEGRSNGIFVAKHDDDLNGILLSRLVIGYSVYLRTIQHGNHVSHTTSQLLAFGPVESCILSVPEADMPDFDEILPEDDDETALKIRQSLELTPPDLLRLNELFGELTAVSSMQLEFYLNYLNHIFDPDELDIALDANFAYRFNSADGKYYQMFGDDADQELKGVVEGFRVMAIGDETFLCFEFTSFVHDGDTLLIPVDQLQQAEAPGSNPEA